MFEIRIIESPDLKRIIATSQSDIIISVEEYNNSKLINYFLVIVKLTIAKFVKENCLIADIEKISK